MANSADPDQLASSEDLHCLQKQDISEFSRTRGKGFIIFTFTDAHDQIDKRTDDKIVA